MSESHDHKDHSPATPATTDAPHDPHAPHGDHAHHDMHLGLYLGVGLGLLVATVITVWLSYVDLGHKWNIIVAMIVASIKVGFVAAIFMHLKGEKWTIWKFLLFTMFFVAGLFMLTLLHYADPIFGTGHTHH
jgi:caa(3)-type oxidase subunit IV